MTFMRPPPGAAFCISGSTLAGGQITPFELASWSLRFEPPLPTVPPPPVLGAQGARRCPDRPDRAGPAGFAPPRRRSRAATGSLKPPRIGACAPPGDAGLSLAENAQWTAAVPGRLPAATARPTPARRKRNQAMESRPPMRCSAP
jgi:hypothetical protein